MNKKTLIIGIAAILLLSGAAYYYSTINDEFKSSCVKFIDTHLLGKSNDVILKKVPIEIYAIADGTGSRYLNYAIPELNTEFIEITLDKMYHKDGGRFWLSYIDRNSKNNKVLYFNVPSILETEMPKRKNGETSFSFTSRLKDWESKKGNFRKDSITLFNNYILEKNIFLDNCKKELRKVYTKGTPDNQWTDIIGSLNSAVATLSQFSVKNSKKFVVCFSDMEQDAPYLKPTPVLTEIPRDIAVLAVNPMQGSSKKIIENILEIEHTSRLYEIMFNN
jgi:hypothetical protein